MTQARGAENALNNIRCENDIYYPRTISEVQQLIHFASINNFSVRTIGSSHSPTDAIFEPTNKKQIKIILDGELRELHKEIKIDESHEFATVKVGAGCNLGVNPRDTKSKLENSFNHQIDQMGYALPMLGGISHQTIAGFLQTSSSGGTSKHNIADVIEEIEWINGKGELCHAKKGEDLFYAVIVSMGSFGIITNVTFKLPKKYLVEGKETNHEFEDSLLAPDKDGKYTKLEKALFSKEGFEYGHINWLAQKYVGRTMEWQGKAVPATPDAKLKPYKHALHSPFASAVAAAVLETGNIIDRKEADHDEALRFKADLLKPFADPKQHQEFLDTWKNALPIDDQAPVDGLIATSFSELWFPQEKMHEVMDKLRHLLATNNAAAGNFIIEIYAAKESPCWLSPSYGHNAFRVDLYWWEHNKGNAKEYFSLFWNALLNIQGARLHWGKHLPLPGETYDRRTYTSHDLVKSYPRFKEWLAWREKMDPQQLFITPYWRKVFDIAPVAKKTLELETQDTLPISDFHLIESAPEPVVSAPKKSSWFDFFRGKDDSAAKTFPDQYHSPTQGVQSKS